MYKIGDRVKIVSDNEHYDNFRDKILIVENYSTNSNNCPAYDETMEGMQLMDFKTEENNESVPFSLYEYEVKISN